MGFLFATNCLSIKLWIVLTRAGSYFSCTLRVGESNITDDTIVFNIIRRVVYCVHSYNLVVSLTSRAYFHLKNAPLCSRPSWCSRKNSFLFATNCLSIKLWIDLTRTGSYFFLSIENCWFVWSNAVWPLFIIFLKKHCKITWEQKNNRLMPSVHLNELFSACGGSLDTIQCTPYDSIQWWVHWCTALCRRRSISRVTVILKTGDAELVL